MSLYAVGDLQGCLTPLKKLLDHVNFDPAADTLWLTGDLVNRGPDSIGCLKFVRSLGSSARTVLGNHDLHLLATYELGITTTDKDIYKTLSHKDAPKLMKWLAKQPMLIDDPDRKLIMTHAGIPPNWSDKKAKKLANELELVLSKPRSRLSFLNQMYGSDPYEWKESLTGMDRLRFIVNAYTRMRFCDPTGRLEFKFKSNPKFAPDDMKPWFEWPTKKRKSRIVFGHWAALMGRTHSSDFLALDTGYVWGNHLTLMNMDSGIRYCCDNDKNITELTELEFECLAEPME